jgi:hypothetical protein
VQGPAVGCVFKHFSDAPVGQPDSTGVSVEVGAGGLAGRCGRNGGQEHGVVASPLQQAGAATGGLISSRGARRGHLYRSRQHDEG